MAPFEFSANIDLLTPQNIQIALEELVENFSPFNAQLDGTQPAALVRLVRVVGKEFDDEVKTPFYFFIKNSLDANKLFSATSALEEFKKRDVILRDARENARIIYGERDIPREIRPLMRTDIRSDRGPFDVLYRLVYRRLLKFCADIDQRRARG